MISNRRSVRCKEVDTCRICTCISVGRVLICCASSHRYLGSSFSCYSMTHVNNLEYVMSVFVQRMSDEVKNSRKGRKGMGKNNLLSYFRLGYPCAFQDAALASQRNPRCVGAPRLHLMLANTCNVAAVWGESLTRGAVVSKLSSDIILLSQVGIT